MHTAVAQDRNRAQLERDHYRRRAQTRINWPCWFTKHGHEWHTHRECQPLAQSEPQVADMMCRFCAQAMCWCQKLLHCVNFFPEILRTSWRWHSTNQDVYIALYSMNTALPMLSHFAALAASDGLRVGINWPTWLRHIDVERVVPADLGRSSRCVW